MSKLVYLKNNIEESRHNLGRFLIEPLEIGEGTTLGNTLRRTLLSDLSGFAITGARINNLKHEFETGKGLREDTLEILLNLNELILKGSFFFRKVNAFNKLKGFLNVKGPKIVTAAMFRLPRNKIKILNPNQYICTITDESELFIEIDIENGKGYISAEEGHKNTMSDKFSPSKPATLRMSSTFMPIKKVNYKVSTIHDTKGNIKESLYLEIVTNGSITPKRSIQESLKILVSMFYPLLADKTFLDISSQLSKKFYKRKKF